MMKPMVYGIITKLKLLGIDSACTIDDHVKYELCSY